MANSLSLNLGSKPLPDDIGTVWTESDGQPLALGDGVNRFTFEFRLTRFRGRLEQAAGRARLALSADLAPLPYSAESPAARAALIRIVEAAGAHLGAGAFQIADGRITMAADLDIAAPVTAHGLISSVTRYLVRTTPYLDLVYSVVIAPLAPLRPGESRLRAEWRRKPA